MKNIRGNVWIGFGMAVSLMAAGAVNASVTYLYEGPEFTSQEWGGIIDYTPPCPSGVFCANYPQNARITGQFTVESALAPNTYYGYQNGYQEIAPLSANISDSINNINPGNGYLGISGSTGPNGEFQSASGAFMGFQWQTEPGLNKSFNQIISGTADTATNAGICREVSQTYCGYLDGTTSQTSYASINEHGVWVMSQGQPQSQLGIVAPTTIQPGQPVPLSTIGGSGSGFVYYIVTNGSARSFAAASPQAALECKIVDGVLTATGGPGICEVTAIKLADLTYGPTEAKLTIQVSGGSPTPPNPIPTLSEWAQMAMMLMMIVTAGWYGRRVS